MVCHYECFPLEFITNSYLSNSGLFFPHCVSINDELLSPWHFTIVAKSLQLFTTSNMYRYRQVEELTPTGQLPSFSSRRLKRCGTACLLLQEVSGPPLPCPFQCLLGIMETLWSVVQNLRPQCEVTDDFLTRIYKTGACVGRIANSFAHLIGYLLSLH